MGMVMNELEARTIMANNSSVYPGMMTVKAQNPMLGISPRAAGVTNGAVMSANVNTPPKLGVNYASPAIINPNATQSMVPQTGLIGSEQALRGGFTGAMNSMNYGAQSAENVLQPTAQQGMDAATAQANLSGANGLQAQQQAYVSMQDNPAQKYQMEQMQKATEQSAAARGGLLGGNTLRALQENAAGIATQNYQNQFNNLGTVADRGTQLQTQIASLRNNLGLNQSQLFSQTGEKLADGRTNAGLAIAQNAANTANSISDLLARQGLQVSQNMSGDINTIANLLHESGMNDSTNNVNLAQILANISGGQASNIQSANNQIGQYNAAGTIGVGNAVSNGITQGVQLGAFSPKTTTSQPMSQTATNSMNAGSTTNGYTGQNYSTWAGQQ